MSFNLTTIEKMIDAGFTADEIRTLDTDGLFTYADPKEPDPKEPDPKEPDPKEPEPKDPKPKETDPKINTDFDDLKSAINDGFASIIEAFQASAVGGSKQPEESQDSVEDILAKIISPFGNK